MAPTFIATKQTHDDKTIKEATVCGIWTMSTFCCTLSLLATIIVFAFHMHTHEKPIVCKINHAENRCKAHTFRVNSCSIYTSHFVDSLWMEWMSPCFFFSLARGVSLLLDDVSWKPRRANIICQHFFPFISYSSHWPQSFTSCNLSVDPKPARLIRAESTRFFFSFSRSLALMFIKQQIVLVA